MKPYYDEDGITIYHGDCREVLPDVDASVLVTDPPFNIGKDYGTASDDLDDDSYRLLIEEVVKLGPTVQAWYTPNIHWRLFGDIMPEAVPVVIHRRASGPLRHGWSSQFNLLMVTGKPNRPIPDLWNDVRLKGEGYFFRENDYGHPGYTPKPIFDRLIDVLSEPVDVVVDPFMGSGTSAVSAVSARRTYVGIEIEERYCEIAVQRLAQGVLDFAE